MCDSNGRRVKPTNKVVTVYKEFSTKANGQLCPQYDWHGRCQAHKRGVWLKAQPPKYWTPHQVKTQVFGFHAYVSNDGHYGMPVKFRRVVHRGPDVIVAHWMFIPKGAK